MHRDCVADESKAQADARDRIRNSVSDEKLGGIPDSLIRLQKCVSNTRDLADRVRGVTSKACGHASLGQASGPNVPKAVNSVPLIAEIDQQIDELALANATLQDILDRIEL